MSTKSKSTVTRQIQTVFVVSIVLLLTSSAASFYSNRAQIEAARQVAHTNEVIRTAYQVTTIVREAESGQRGFILTGDEAFLNVYNGAQEQALTNLRTLRALAADNPAQQQNLIQLKVLLDERFAQLARVLGKYQRLGNQYSAAANALTDFTAGRNTMAELQGLADKIQAQEAGLLKLRTDRLELYNTYTPVLLVVAALLSILISLLAFVRIKADVDARERKRMEDAAVIAQTSRRINAMEGVTSRLAAGDFSARSEDATNDELGKIAVALNKMGSALGKNFRTLEERAYMQQGVVALADAMRGERGLAQVAAKIIQSIATYLHASVGTMYLGDDSVGLRLKGAYAASDAPEEIAPGEGLMSQALQDGQLIVARNLPQNYLRIRSSIGQTGPLHSIILPLLYGGHAMGAIELGLLHEPQEHELHFLKANAETIAISLNAAIIFERTQALLEETQAQSEELQAQHSEMENINAELEMQSEKLQASEEELRVQQEELQRTNAELEERSRLLEERNEIITLRNAEVQRQAEALAVSAKYKSEFMANMSHELRTPLNSILLLSRLLGDNHEETLSAEQVEYARIIQSSGNGLLSLIDEILDLSKIEAGKMLLESDEVPLTEIASDMEGLFQPVADEKGVSLFITVDDSLPDTITTDKMRVEQILKNLLSNALKFTREGRVSLSIARAEAGEDKIVFTVTDTGIGIPADKQALIFEAFQQADGSTRRKYGGTGLGLSISKELSRLLGGSIALRSEVGTGSSFTLTLPFEKPEDAPAEAEVAPVYEAPVAASQPAEGSEYISSGIPESIPDDRQGLKPSDKVILIVEDDVAFAKSLLDFTRKRGYKGVVSVRGDEGITLAQQLKPVGILLDIQLPVKSGWQVMDELKANPVTRPIPVHIMSSHSVKRESLMKGAVDFINKPFAFEQMSEIFGKIEHVLSGPAKKVLIVEDNPKHAGALAYYLGSANIVSDIKTSVAESVTALQQGADCVILDMGIPDAIGYETLEEIKKAPGLENLPIIVFTGKSLSLTEEQRIRRYADSIIVKTAHSYQRVLDEVSIFLHIVEGGAKAGNGSGAQRPLALREVLNGKTVLAVDDDVRNIFSLTKALETLNMHIVTAVDGKDALEQLATHPETDIVLLDMMMPQMDGYETATRIRENPAWAELPVIAVTAKAMSGDREKCIRAGASDYITKPIDIDQLISLLRVWLHDRDIHSITKSNAG